MAGRMHENQVATSAGLVRRLLEEQYPVLAGEPIADVPMHGTDTDVYRVGDRHCVRLPIVTWAFDQQERVRPWLPWLRDRLSLPPAVPEFYGAPACGYPAPWCVQQWVPGRRLQPGSDDAGLAVEIADNLRELRAHPIHERAPKAGLSPHDMDADVRERLAALAGSVGDLGIGARTPGAGGADGPQAGGADGPQAGGADGPEVHEDLAAAWTTLLEATPPWDGGGALWLHGDVAPGNLIVRDGSLVGLIDWGGVGVGEPANDLQVAWNLFTPNAREAFRRAIDVPDATWRRARARAFAQAPFQLSFYRLTLPPLAEQARHTFSQVLGELGV